MTTTLVLTAHESVEIRRSTPELLEVQATYLPGKPPPRHFHPAQDERFELLAGELRFELAGRTRTLRPGETIAVPRGTPHRVWNPGERPARAVWSTAPRGETERWFRALDSLQRAGRTTGSGAPRPLDALRLLARHREAFRLAGPGRALRPLLALLARAGPRLGS